METGLRFWLIQTTLGLALLSGCSSAGGAAAELGADPLDLSVPSHDGSAPDAAAGDGGRTGEDGGTAVPGSVCTPSGFCFEYPAQFGITFNDVWASAPSDVWAVGYSGALLHFDGLSWTIARSPTRNTLYGIVGRSSSDILAVGEAGTVIHYDGVSWSAIDVGTTATLYDVAMPAAGESWIAGEKVLLRRTTSTWQAVVAPYLPTTRTYLHAVDPVHLWMFHAGTAQLWNGTAWSVVDLATGVGAHAATSVSGKTPDAVYACVEQESSPLRSWNGTKFVRVNLPEPVRLLALNLCAVAANTPSDVWLFGDHGIGHFDGTSWTVVESSLQRAVRSAWVDGAAGLAVGNDGRVLTRSGTGWVVQNAGSGSANSFAQSIRAQSGIEWTAIGGALLRRSAGGTWQRTAHDKLEVGGLLPVDATHAWAVSTSADADSVLYWNGTSFESKATAVASYWMNQSWQSAATGEILFVGESGITSYLGGVFTRLVTVGTYGWVQDVDGVAGSDTWAVGFAGAAWRRRLPAGFTLLPTGTTVDLDAVHVVSSSEVYLGGDQSTLLRYDGSTFKSVALPALRFGSRNYRIVLGLAGELSSPRGLWVLVSGGEVIELHDGKAPVIHSIYFEGNHLAFTRPDELVVVGSGDCIVRKKL